MTDPAANALAAPAGVVFIGLGQMGLPMAGRLVAAGYSVLGLDPAAAAREQLRAQGGRAEASATDASAAGAVAEAAAVVTMLPNGRIVREALLGPAGVAGALKPGTLVIDMSSSAPAETQALGQELQALGLGFIDAPVSGGAQRAQKGTLAVMAGGDAALVERARPLFAALATSVFATGPVGSGHAMKALNNYVSAAGFAAAAEALLVGRRFGLDPAKMVEILNVSTGRNNSTEHKMQQFVLSDSFASGFALALMAKDLRTAADLADHLGFALPGLGSTAAVWESASQQLGKSADHTEFYRFLSTYPGGKDEP